MLSGAPRSCLDCLASRYRSSWARAAGGSSIMGGYARGLSCASCPRGQEGPLAGPRPGASAVRAGTQGGAGPARPAAPPPRPPPAVQPGRALPPDRRAAGRQAGPADRAPRGPRRPRHHRRGAGAGHQPRPGRGRPLHPRRADPGGLRPAAVGRHRAVEPAAVAEGLDLGSPPRWPGKMEGHLPGAGGGRGEGRGHPAPVRPRARRTAVKEREAKLTAPPGFDLPELGGPDDAFQAEPQSARRLQTTYYDTADLRLARWGASLRYRPGEGWTVKLPEGHNGALLDRLLEAGAQATEPTPKYLRALNGRERVLGPEVEEPEVDGDATVEALLRHDLASGTLRLFRHEAGVRTGEDPEAVHQARVATRRVRSTLRTFSKLLDEEWTDRLRDDLKWLANLLGEVRDTDVLLERFSEHLAALPAADVKAGPRLLAKLEEQRDHARRRLLGGMAAEKYAVLLDDLVAAAAAPALLPGVDGPAAEIMPPLVARPWKKLRKEVRKAGDDPPDEQLHQIRIRAKRARYAAEAVEPVIGKPAERFADAVADLQDVLGDQHDAVVGEAWLRQAAARAARRDEALVAGLLAAADRAGADAARAAWRPAWKALDRKKLRSWF